MKSKYESARRSVQRIARLRNRMNYLVKYKTHEHALAEVSALEWAIPILEEYTLNKFGELPPERSLIGINGMQVLNKLYKEKDGMCYLCGEHIDNRKHASVDHVVPLARGGADDESNYDLAHIKCNNDKGEMLLETYREYQRTGKKESKKNE